MNVSKMEMRMLAAFFALACDVEGKSFVLRKFRQDVYSPLVNDPVTKVHGLNTGKPVDTGEFASRQGTGLCSKTISIKKGKWSFGKRQEVVVKQFLPQELPTENNQCDGSSGCFLRSATATEEDLAFMMSKTKCSKKRARLWIRAQGCSHSDKYLFYKKDAYKRFLSEVRAHEMLQSPLLLTYHADYDFIHDHEKEFSCFVKQVPAVMSNLHKQKDERFQRQFKDLVGDDPVVVSFRREKDLLEYVEDQNVFFSARNCLRMLKQMAEILADVHGKGLVHKDVKLENFLVRSVEHANTPEEFPTIELFDWESSRVFHGQHKDELTSILAKTGTCFAPETVDPSLLTNRACEPFDDWGSIDIWAVGEALFIYTFQEFLWLNAERAGEGGVNPRDLLRQHANLQAGQKFDLQVGADQFVLHEFDKQWNTRIKNDISEFGLLFRLMYQMFSWDPAARPSAQDLANALRRLDKDVKVTDEFADGVMAELTRKGQSSDCTTMAERVKQSLSDFSDGDHTEDTDDSQDTDDTDGVDVDDDLQELPSSPSPLLASAACAIDHKYSRMQKRDLAFMEWFENIQARDY